MTTLYAGPGKLFANNLALWPEGENGTITATVEQAAEDVASGFFGRVTSLQGNALARIRLTPFDNWSALPLLFPPYLGVTVGATGGSLLIGARPHGTVDVPAKIWTPDGRVYTFTRTAVTQHPDLHLGIGAGLFGPVELTAILGAGKKLGDPAALYTITETGAADPGGQMSLADFARGAWTGVWGPAAGFGGDGASAPLEAEDEWTLVSEVRYSPLTVQQLVRAYKLDSVKFLIKVRPYGPRHTDLDAAIGVNNGRTLGARFAAGAAADLVLTGPANKTITLKNADVVGAGFEFGGTRLGTGEIGFINGMTFSSGGNGQPAAGAPLPLVVFGG